MSEKEVCEEIAHFLRSLEGKTIPYNVIKKLILLEKELERCGVKIWKKEKSKNENL